MVSGYWGTTESRLCALREALRRHVSHPADRRRRGSPLVGRVEVMSMLVQSDFMGFPSDFMKFHGDLLGFHGNLRVIEW